jgi:hypothetical protein
MLSAIIINVILLNVIMQCVYVLNFFLLNVIMSSFCFENSAEYRGNNFKDSLLILRQKIVHHWQTL